MEVEYLREYVELCHVRNFTRAASRVGVSRTALSKHISAIEREFGVTLLQRTNQLVELTPAGKAFLSSSQLLLESWDELHREMDKYGHQQTMRLKIGLFKGHKPTDDLTDTVIGNLQGRGVPIEVEVSEITEPCMQSLREGKYDLTSPVHAADEDMTGLAEELFLEEPLAAIVPANNPLAHKDVLSPSDLTGNVVLVARSPEFIHYTHYVEDLLARKGVCPRYVNIPYTSFADLSRSLSLINGGIFLIHASVARYTIPLTSTSFKALRFDDEDMKLPIYITWRADDENPALRMFVDEFMALSRSIDLCMYWR